MTKKKGDEVRYRFTRNSGGVESVDAVVVANVGREGEADILDLRVTISDTKGQPVLQTVPGVKRFDPTFPEGPHDAQTPRWFEHDPDEETDDAEDDRELEDMTKKELIKMAGRRGIVGGASMSKANLVEAIVLRMEHAGDGDDGGDGRD